MMKNIVKYMLAMLFGLILISALACTPTDKEMLAGILQNIDSANGQITLVTKDGRTITINVDSDTLVNTDGTDSSLDSLEVGASIEVEVEDDGKVARHIEANQAKVEGTISGIDNQNLTVSGRNGVDVTVVVTENTRIELSDVHGGPELLGNLQAGNKVEVKYNPDNMQALKVEVEEEDHEDEKDGDTEVEGSNDAEDAGHELDNEETDQEVHEEKDDESDEPPAIPHDIAGRENCLACHQEGGIKPFPSNHVGRTNDICQSCHIAASGN